MNQYLLIRRLHVHAANAISGPLTYGLPSMTAFLGFGHALERHLTIDAKHDHHAGFRVHGVGVVTHQVQMLDHREKYERTLRITANPVNEKGSRPSFVEEGRCHLIVSLVMEVSGITRDDQLIDDARDVMIGRMKLAGGDLQGTPRLEFIMDDRSSIRKLMPGYGLLDRRDLLREQMRQQNEADDALDALHQAIAIHSQTEMADEDDAGQVEAGEIVWRSKRIQPGWIVPITVGYQAVSPIETTLQTRDSKTPHRFAEAVTTLGEFVMASRVDSLADLIWRYQVEGDFYLASQRHLSDQMTSTHPANSE